MSFFHAIILGLVQGLTEFIPVSSSGHLIITHHFFGAQSNDLAIDAVLQLATVLAVCVYFRIELWKLLINFFRFIFRKEIVEEEKTLLVSMILGTIPAVILGVLLEKYMETTFRSTHLVALTLVLGSALMYGAEKMSTQVKKLSPVAGFRIGLFQSLALIPGISRSGATISGGLFNGLSREEATRFSFLLSFPIIFGSGLKKLFDLVQIGGVLDLLLGVSFFIAFFVGLGCIHFLLKYLRNNSLQVFIWYRVLLAVVLLLWL